MGCRAQRERTLTLNARVFTFSISLGMSFGILVLFLSSVEAIALVVVLITASIVVSSTTDLTTIKEERNLPLIMVTAAVMTFVGVSLEYNVFGDYAFFELFAINMLILLVYIAMRLASRTISRSPGRD